jgi:hypothetical protein
VVLSDARQIYAPDAVRELLKNFADPAVGAASGELHLIGDEVSNVGASLGLTGDTRSGSGGTRAWSSRTITGNFQLFARARWLLDPR